MPTAAVVHSAVQDVLLAAIHMNTGTLSSRTARSQARHSLIANNIANIVGNRADTCSSPRVGAACNVHMLRLVFVNDIYYSCLFIT